MTKKDIQKLFQWMADLIGDSLHARIGLEVIVRDGTVCRIERSVRTSVLAEDFNNEEK